jgi:hypothetical protein
VRDFDFSYSSLVLYKEKITGAGFHQSGESLYKYCSSLLFSNIEEELDEATVIFDKSGSYAFQKGLDRYLKERINLSGDRRPIKKVKAQRSDGNNLIQLADMVCGAVARSFRTDRKNPMACRKIIEEKEIRVQVWPNQKKSPPPIP